MRKTGRARPGIIEHFSHPKPNSLDDKVGNMVLIELRMIVSLQILPCGRDLWIVGLPAREILVVIGNSPECVDQQVLVGEMELYASKLRFSP
jgi:hypothetical protein